MRRAGDWLERQADQAALAARADPHAAARADRREALACFARIAPAPAPPLDAGTPLPQAARTQLEHAFDADLGNVRLHDDPSAAALAHGLGARAFAAGRHVVLGEGESSRAGYAELLAHEVAHVLQQAGRRGPDGRLHVADVSGGGAVQRTPIVLATSTPIPTIAQIGARHIAGDSPIEPDLEAYVQGIEADIAARTEATVIAELATEVLTPPAAVTPPTTVTPGARPAIGTLSWKHKSYVVDLLKRAGRHDAAVLLLRGNALRTTFYSNELYQLLAATPADIGTVPRWNALPIFADLRGDAFGFVAMEYFLGTTRPIQDIRGISRLDAALATRNAATALLELGTGTTRALVNERDYATIAAVRRLKGWLTDKLADLAQQVTTTSTAARDLDPTQRREVARRFLAWATAIEGGTEQPPTRESDEVQALIRHLAPTLVIAARHSLTILDALLGGADLTDAEVVQAQRDALGRGADRPEFTHFLRTYGPRFHALLDLDADGNIPSVTTFAAAHRALLDGLLPYLQLTFEVRGFGYVRNAIEAAARQRPYRGPNPLPYLAMARQLAELRRLLMGYDPAADRAVEAELAPHRPADPPSRPPGAPVPQPGIPDHRVRHRIVIGRWLSELAAALGWVDLTRLGVQVVRTRQAGPGGAAIQPHSYVALFGTWRASTDQRVNRLTEDFASGNEIAGFRPLTAGDLVTFYHMLYYEDLAARVRRILGEDRAASRVGETAILSRALVESQTSFVGPRRYEHEGPVEYAIRPGDESGFGALLRAHPTTRRFMTENNVAATRPLTLTPLTVVQPPYIWALPSFERLVTRLRTITLLDDIVLAQQQADLAAQPAAPAEPGVEAPAPPSLERVQRLPWDDWLLLLSRALSAGAVLAPAALTALDAFRASSRTLRAAQIRAFHAAAREATTYDRVGRVRRVIRPLLAQYDRYDELSRVMIDVSGLPPAMGLIYTIPDLVLSEIDRFMGIVQPADEQSAQVSAMVLELAQDGLSRLLGVDEGDSLDTVGGVRFSIVVGLRPLVQSVIQYVDGRDSTPAGQTRRTLLDAALLPAERSDAWITPRMTRLRAIDTALGRMLTTGQAMFGMRGIKVNPTHASRENFFESVGHGTRIMLGTPFTIDGRHYRVRELEHSFEYHEAYGSGAARLNSTLTIDGRERTWADRAADRTPLFSIEIGSATNVQTITAHQSHDALLESVSRAVQMQAIVASLQELGEALETFSMLMLDAAEFIPGAGQAVMVARLAIVITQFIASGEMDEIINLIRRDPQVILEQAGRVVQRLLQPELLLQYFLFGVNHLDELGRGPRPTAGPRPIVTRSGGRGRIARVARRLWQFGRNLLAAFGRVQGRVRHRAERTQMFLFRKRYVPRILRFLADNLPRIGAVSETVMSFVEDAPSPADALARLDAIMNDIPGTLAGLLDDMDTIRLPYQLIDPADILHIIVDLVVRRLGGKYRIAVNLMLTLLDRLGFRADIERAIADRLVGVWDPNVMYRNLFGVPDEAGVVREGPLVTPMKTVRDEIVGGLLLAVARIPFLPPRITGEFRREGSGIADRSFEVRFTREGFEGESDEAEAEGYRASPPDLSIPLPHAPSMGGGAPLPAPLRHDAESRFGHDFSHVRVHGGAEGSSFTGRFGAEALTSGSHVFVRPGVSLGGSGRDVLHHELTHVLQQTGPRPIAGGSYDPSPVAGTPGRGLRVDPARERAADRVASSLRHGGASSPVDPGRPAATGLQPVFGEAWIQRVTNLMTTSTVAAHAPAGAGAAASASSHLPADIRTQVQGVGNEIETRLRAALTPGPTSVLFESPFDNDTRRIRDYLLEGPRLTAIKNAIEPLARDASQPRRPAAVTGTAPPPGPGTTTEPRDLDIPDFEAQLSRHIVDTTGILLHIDFPLPHQAAPAPLRMGRMRVVSIHLPLISSNSWFFQQAVDQAEAQLRTRVPAIPNLTRERVMRWTQTYLEGARGIDPANWTTHTPATSGGAHFKLAGSIVTAIGDLIAANIGGPTPLAARNLPIASQYADPNPQAPVQSGQAGLRIGVFGDAAQVGPDRESHHITQFILLEYFANLHDVKAFPHASQPALYGGSATGNALQTLGTGSAATPPQVTGFGGIGLPTSVAGTRAEQRGPGMPAVLLAGDTHRTARLHIHNTPEDFLFPTPAPIGERGSANILRHWYHTDLRARLPSPGAGVPDFVASERAGPAAMQTYLDTPPSGRAAGAPQQQYIATAIEESMKATYAQIRSFMQPRLRTGLYTVERTYYRVLAEEAGHAADSRYQLTPGQMARVFDASVARNTAVLETQNHWA